MLQYAPAPISRGSGDTRPADLTVAGERAVRVPFGAAEVPGSLIWPEHPSGLVLVTQGGGTIPGPVELGIARELRRAGLATLHFNVQPPARTGPPAELEPERLGARLLAATEWALVQPEVDGLMPGYLATGVGTAAAMHAAASSDGLVRAVVSLGGRPDLAGDALATVQVPTLLLAGSRDEEALEPSRRAFRRLVCLKRLVVITGASRRLEEPGALEETGRWAAGWLVEHLAMVPRRQQWRRSPAAGRGASVRV
jgi:putative phosphoribosyl transferase